MWNYEVSIARFCNRTRDGDSCQVANKRKPCKEESAGGHLGADLWTAAPQRHTRYQDNLGRTLHFCCLRYGDRETALYGRCNFYPERSFLHPTRRLHERYDLLRYDRSGPVIYRKAGRRVIHPDGRSLKWKKSVRNLEAG